MTDSRATAPPSRHSAELLILTATAALGSFYYLARADTIGVLSPTHGWVPMTASALASEWHFALSALLLGVVPLVLARRATGLSLAQLGLGLGNARAGLLLLAAGIPLAVTAGAIAAASPAMRVVYPLDPVRANAGFAAYATIQLLYFGAWELLFRGVLLFGLRPRLGGSAANVLQTALSVTAHFGRAINETAAALPAGLLFGLVDLRIGSIWYITIIHWTTGVSMDWFILHWGA